MVFDAVVAGSLSLLLTLNSFFSIFDFEPVNAGCAGFAHPNQNYYLHSQE